MTELFRHPTYESRRSLWQRALDLYEANPQVLSRPEYLWPHAIEISKEDPENAKTLRAAREMRTRHLPLHKLIVAIWQNLFFRKPGKPDEELKRLLDTHDGFNNIDGLGTSLPMFVKNKVLPSVLLYGNCYVLADAGGRLGRTRREQKEQNFRAYLEVINPLSVVDWDIETSDSKRFGKYNFVRYEYDIIEPRKTATDKISRLRMSDSLEYQEGRYVIRRFQLGETPKEYNQIVPDLGANPQFKEVDIIETNMAEVPLATITGDAWLDGLGEESLRFHNIRSCYDSINYNQLYQKIFLVGVEGEDIPKALSEYIYGLLPDGASVIVVDPVDTSGYERAMADALNNAFKAGLLMTRQLPADSRAVQSTETIQEEKDATLASIEATIEDIETLTNQALFYYAAFMGEENFTGTFELNHEVVDEDFTQLITIYQAFKTELNKVENVTKGVLEKVIMRLGLNEEAQTAALQALETTDLRPQEMPLMQSLFNRSIEDGDNRPDEDEQ